MAWMRCALTGGEFLPWSWEELEAGRRPEFATGDWFLSLVPTQLQRLLAQPEAADWLRRFRAVFLGGGPPWPELLERAAEAGVPLALSYGLTETAAMVAALRPQEFIAGGRSSGAVMPHVRLEVTAEGTLRIAGESVFRGYFPEWRLEREVVTEDLGFLDEHGHVHVTRRRDDVIITGGKKVRAAEVEAALQATGQFADVVVVGVPDLQWGQAVVACYPADGKTPDFARVAQTLAGQLAAHAWPKRFEAVTDWPRNAQGKLNRAALAARLSAGAHPGGEDGR
jgi:o-succinylbenzoate---CoA ligase